MAALLALGTYYALKRKRRSSSTPKEAASAPAGAPPPPDEPPEEHVAAEEAPPADAKEVEGPSELPLSYVTTLGDGPPDPPPFLLTPAAEELPPSYNTTLGSPGEAPELDTFLTPPRSATAVLAEAEAAAEKWEGSSDPGTPTPGELDTFLAPEQGSDELDTFLALEPGSDEGTRTDRCVGRSLHASGSSAGSARLAELHAPGQPLAPNARTCLPAAAPSPRHRRIPMLALSGRRWRAGCPPNAPSSTPSLPPGASSWPARPQP